MQVRTRTTCHRTPRPDRAPGEHHRISPVVLSASLFASGIRVERLPVRHLEVQQEARDERRLDAGPRVNGYEYVGGGGLSLVGPSDAYMTLHRTYTSVKTVT